jgi:predicted enzyme related to lactoylglutathione lyase
VQPEWGFSKSALTRCDLPRKPLAIGLSNYKVFVEECSLDYDLVMEPIIKGAIPVLPAADAAASLHWWTAVCGFKETFRDATPPNYAGINRGDAYLHICRMTDADLARKVGDQTMVRIAVKGIEALYEEFQRNGGAVHPTARCKPNLGEPKNSAPLTPMACASRSKNN